MLKNLSVVSEKVIALNKKQVHDIVKELRKEHSFKLDGVQINFITGETIHELNKEYLNHDYSTDIITFNYNGNNDILEGEIFISIDDAIKNAKEFNVDYENELLRLVTHGFLHLLGFDDTTDEEKKVQKRLENDFVNKYSYLGNNIVRKYDRKSC